MMRWLKAAAVGVVMVLASGSSAFADVQLTIRDGRVTLVAKDATVRQILTEWSRVGQTTIVNVERIPGGPLTLQLTNVPEEQALDVLLRSVSGYMAAPRPTVVANLSRFVRILVMPTSVTPRAPTAAPARPVQQPTFVPPPDLPDDDDRGPEDDEQPVPGAPVPGFPVPTPGRAPVFNTFPQPQVVNPRQGAPATMPGAPGGAPQQQTAPTPNVTYPGGVSYPGQPTAPSGGGVAVPGMIVPAPPQPGQPGLPQPAAPGQRTPEG